MGTKKNLAYYYAGKTGQCAHIAILGASFIGSSIRNLGNGRLTDPCYPSNVLLCLEVGDLVTQSKCRWGSISRRKEYA